MTIAPFYQPRILEMRMEKYAEIAIDGGLWLVGELLAHGRGPHHEFIPDPSYIYQPRHREAAIPELSCIEEGLRHRIFIAGFLRLPDNGAQATFRRLLRTNGEMLNEAFRIEWKRRYGRMIDVSGPHNTAVIELLHKLARPR